MSDIDFYFDFISPYAYLASASIELLATRNGRQVNWRPFRLGVAVVKVMGLRPNMETPLKAPYILSDVSRLSKVLNVPLSPAARVPDPMPPARLFYGAPESERSNLARELFRAHWAKAQDIGDQATLVAIGSEHGMSEADVLHALSAPETRQALTDQTNEAISRGIFGSPTFAVRDELFWGVDRMWLLEHYLRHDCRYEVLPRYSNSVLRVESSR